MRIAHGGFAFWVYGAFGMLAAFVVLRFVPETKGVDSERLGALWRRQNVAVAASAVRRPEGPRSCAHETRQSLHQPHPGGHRAPPSSRR